MDSVIDKVISEVITAVVIMPHWTRENFFAKIMNHAKKKHFYQKGTLVFMDKGDNLSGTPWAIWAVLVDGAKEKDVPERIVHEEPTRHKTTSSRRI